MRKIIVTSFFISFFIVKAQEKEISLGFDIVPKLGTAVLVESNKVNVNGTVNAGDVLFYYKLKKSKFSAGIGVLNFLADGTFKGQEYFLQQSYLRIIPLKITQNVEVFDKSSNNRFQVIVGVETYLNTLLEEHLETIEQKIEIKKSNWNSGVSIDLGMNFDVSKHTCFGIGYQVGGDISSLKKNNNTKGKLRAISTINFTLGIKI